ncbi:hypothetical protein HYZ41_01985 [archaeon]|nr:hypothetical protein [archaeon]
MKFGPLEKAAFAGSVVAYVLFLFMLKSSGMSVGFIVNLQNFLLKSMIVSSAGSSTLSAVSVVVLPFVSIIIALVFLVISLSFAASYGYFSNETKTGLVLGAICAVLTVAFFQTLMTIFIALAAFVSFVYIIPLSNTYGKELKKWVKYRIGSNSIGKTFLIINILLAAGVFVAVLSGLSYYKTNFQAELTDTMTEITMASLPAQGIVNESLVREKVAASIEESQVFNAYFRWLPVFSAFSVWIIMEFLKSLVLSNIAGISTSCIVRFFSRLEK